MRKDVESNLIGISFGVLILGIIYFGIKLKNRRAPDSGPSTSTPRILV
tara:strand:+ start:1397 stop:1540 length:144 start_codon:yes stop_codon:yes gene_type:complete